jgi:hypothetical protein
MSDNRTINDDTKINILLNYCKNNINFFCFLFNGSLPPYSMKVF